jgi:hypothetical protein
MSVRTLVICGDAGHSAQTVARGLSPLAGSGFDFEFLEDTEKWSPEMMMNFSLVVLARANAQQNFAVR